MHIQVFVPFVDLLSELKGTFRVHINHASKLLSVIDFKSNLPSVIGGFLESTLFIENLNNFLMCLGLLINFQGQDLVESCD